MRRLTKIESIVWRTVVAYVDMGLIVLSLLLALWIGFEDEPFWWIWDHYFLGNFPKVVWFAFICVVLLYLFRMYRYAWVYAGLEAARSLIIATLLSSLVLIVVERLVFEERLPRAVSLIFWLLSASLIGSLRVLLRWGIRYIQENFMDAENGTHTRAVRAVLVGPAEYSAGILKAMASTHSLRHYCVIGILAETVEEIGLFYGGVQVLGTAKQLSKFLDEHQVDEVVFALPEESDGSYIRHQVLECRRRNISAKVVPNYAELISRRMPVRLEDISVKDLLRRPMHHMDGPNAVSYLAGKRVLVTGAGGSIGSEICRQVMKAGAAEIILLGHGENSIFRIQQELVRDYPEFSSNIFPIIASITNSARIDRIFKRFRPDVVFNAAAHKHLPLMEYNVCEAVHNNIIGTYNVVQACVKHGAQRMVQISTDKAADPSCVMGATKWFCELIVRTTARKHPDMSLVCVRFGNVLGSRGIVIPVFHEQIRAGGPVTVTHPEMTRYFMAIPEAVMLSIQAGAVGRSGDVHLLDMGKPVRILDLAEDMIRLSGYEPHVDIPIVYTGIRSGEKMHESLASSKEQVSPTGYPGLNRVEGDPLFSYEQTLDFVERMTTYVNELDGGAILSMFEEVIPGYANSARAVFTRLVS